MSNLEELRSKLEQLAETRTTQRVAAAAEALALLPAVEQEIREDASKLLDWMQQETVVRCADCNGAQMHKLVNGEILVLHDCAQGKHTREMLEYARAEAEQRTARRCKEIAAEEDTAGRVCDRINREFHLDAEVPNSAGADPQGSTAYTVTDDRAAHDSVGQASVASAPVTQCPKCGHPKHTSRMHKDICTFYVPTLGAECGCSYPQSSTKAEKVTADPPIDQQIIELEQAGWTRGGLRYLWKSPDGMLWLGQYGAWVEMRRRKEPQSRQLFTPNRYQQWDTATRLAYLEDLIQHTWRGSCPDYPFTDYQDVLQRMAATRQEVERLKKELQEQKKLVQEIREELGRR